MWILIACWTAAVLGLESTRGEYADPHCQDGTNGIVHLFEWKWADIEKECAQLSTAGFCGLQTSVPTEHMVGDEMAWWQRLLPVSYQLASRSGDEEAFRSMVETCNAANIRVYVQLELNHMSSGKGRGYAGTDYDGDRQDYPGVPYNSSHFHNSSDCSSPNLTPSSPSEDMQKCSKLDYPDLDQSNPYVTETMVDLFNKLVSMGVSGFFLKDAVHISPEDLQEILAKVNDVQTGGRPFVTFEIINTIKSSVDPHLYFPIGRVTDFTMSERLGKAIEEDKNLSGLCRLLQVRTSLISPDDASLIPPQQAVAFVHDEDYQRGLAPSKVPVLTYKNPEMYKLALSLLIASGYGLPRIMSSYEFDDNDQGPPVDDEGNILDVIGDKETRCENTWVCEHRMKLIHDAIEFSQDFAGQTLKNCKATKNTISFSRGDTGHFWAALGSIDRLWDDLPKVQRFESGSDATIDVLDTGGLTLWNFEQKATVVYFRGPMTTVATTTTSKPTTTTTTPKPTTTTRTTTPKPTTTTTPRPTTTTTTPKPTTTTMTSTTTRKPKARRTLKAKSKTTTSTTTPTTTRKPKARRTLKLKLKTTTLTTTPTTTRKPKPVTDYRRTVILIRKSTRVGEEVFIRGYAGSSKEPIPIRHNDLGVRRGTPQRDRWTIGDNFLDWNDSPEKDQTEVGNGGKAKGTPAQWTTSNRRNNYYHPLNTKKDHYWIVDVDMDCLKTEDGFFEFRGIMQDKRWESSRRNLGYQCRGMDSVPRKSVNHFALCGKINIYYSWGNPTCETKDF